MKSSWLWKATSVMSPLWMIGTGNWHVDATSKFVNNLTLCCRKESEAFDWCFLSSLCLQHHRNTKELKHNPDKRKRRSHSGRAAMFSSAPAECLASDVSPLSFHVSNRDSLGEATPLPACLSLFYSLFFEAESSYVDSYICRIRVSASAFWMAGLTGVALPHQAKNLFLSKAQSFPCHVTDRSSLEY